MKIKGFAMCLCAAVASCMLSSNLAFAAGVHDNGNEVHGLENCDNISIEGIVSILPSESTPAAEAEPGKLYYSKKATEGAVSNNVQINGYDGSYHASPMYSYLYEWNENLYRLEYIDGKIILEKYDPNLKFLGNGEIKPELPIFGGFFAGEEYNFIVYGDMNLSESNNKEVIRVVKYTKGMKRVSAKSIYGCNTYIPFDAGCPRMDERDGILYIHTSHEMYRSSDGYHHQANMDLYIRISDMSTVYSNYNVSNPSMGYMSHSFNQFIKVNENGIYTVDHGDAYNRAITAFRRADTSSKYAGYEDIFKIKGKIGENYTGVCVGGMELGEDYMLVVGTSVPQDSTFGKASQKNLFVIKVPMYSGDKTSIQYLTHYDKSDNITFSEPKLVKTGDDRFMLLWTETKSSETKLFVTMLDGNGKEIGKRQEYSAYLSDCQPIVYNGKVTYYVTKGGVPVFYFINSNG